MCTEFLDGRQALVHRLFQAHYAHLFKMINSIYVNVLNGSMKGKTFTFVEHDTFLFGRLEECRCNLPDDPLLSRVHFIIEMNPPDARIRDFGSLNGTYVNEIQIGRREKGETPGQGQKRKYPEVDLKDGDTIRAGATVLSVKIEREDATGPVICAQCGKDVAGEIGGRQIGSYICQDCRQNLAMDPAKVLRDMLAKMEGNPAQKEGLPVIAGYRIKRRIGIGGYGAVYLAESEKDARRVAIKVMLARVAVDDQARTKFSREIELLTGLQHENVVAVYDSGSAGSAFYIVMEHCPGGSVADYMEAQGGKLTPSVALPIMQQALQGLAYVHHLNLVHRDLKPQNILMAGSPSVPIAKIADLGLAKNFERAGLSGHTMTGVYAGTPIYMPKEQLTEYKYVKPVSDVWSLGASFYHMLTGFTPRDFPKGYDPLEIILKGEIVPIRLRDPCIPAGLADILDRSIQGNPRDRYSDAAEMLADIEALRL